MPITHITLIIPSLHGGGAERSALNLATGFAARGIHTELLLLKDPGDLGAQIPDSVQVTVYGRTRTLGALLDLRRYFRQHHPDAVISFLSHANLLVLVAHMLARSDIPVIPTVRSDLDIQLRDSRKERVIVLLSRLIFRRAARVIGVSEGVSESIRRHIIARNVETIYNPTVMPHVAAQAQGPPPHPWFTAPEPVIVAAGRLVAVKGFDVLLAAFAQVRDRLPARLIILGEGKLRADLEAQVAALGLSDVVALPGFAENPYRYFAHADLFVLSSRYEGLPNALIEAVACGAPVVATDCRSGPREILVDGQYGPLVPVDDVDALAQAMHATLTDSPDRAALVARAGDFSLDRSVDRFLALIEAL